MIGKEKEYTQTHSLNSDLAPIAERLWCGNEEKKHREVFCLVVNSHRRYFVLADCELRCVAFYQEVLVIKGDSMRGKKAKEIRTALCKLFEANQGKFPVGYQQKGPQLINARRIMYQRLKRLCTTEKFSIGQIQGLFA